MGRGRTGVMAGATVATLLAAVPALGIDGTEWRQLSPPAQAAYVTGVVDAWQSLVAVQEALGSRDVAITVYVDVVQCVRDRLWSYAHLAEMVERYMDANRGRWSGEMPDLIFAALGEQCRR